MTFMSELSLSRRVVIAQHRLLHYRVKLFALLREACEARNIQLHLVHGQATKQEAVKNDTGTLDWAHVVRNRYATFGGLDIVWQPFPPSLSDSALVILMQENRLLSNYPWLFGRGGRSTKVAFWGHGRNFQSSSPNGLRERWKAVMANKVDWWFAYTGTTKQILVEHGYPEKRITVLNNSIDDYQFESDLRSISHETIARRREQIAACPRAPIAVFCGSLYPDKRIDFLIVAADLIHAQLPAFRLVMIGDGPSSPVVRHAQSLRPWMTWVGAQRGLEKAAWFRVADIVLNPGAVGLHVLDAFCAGLPMVTVADSLHGPEIEYLHDGVNGMLVEGDASQYADRVIRLLSDSRGLALLKVNARGFSARYSLQSMVESFCSGIESCLASPPRRSASAFTSARRQ